MADWRTQGVSGYQGVSVNSTVKTVVFWLVILLSAVLLWTVVKNSSGGQKDVEKSYTQFINDVNQGNVAKVTINGQEVRGEYKDKTQFHTTAPATAPDMYKSLLDKGVVVNIRDITSGG